jgi:hypothetical protein
LQSGRSANSSGMALPYRNATSPVPWPSDIIAPRREDDWLICKSSIVLGG